MNAVDIADCLNGNSALVDGQFGEFAINLTDLLGGQCRAFGSILAKSRSSNQVTSNLNDLVLPIPVDFSTCGQITILKQDELQQALGGATFSVTPNPFTGSGSLSVTDNAAPDDNAAAGTIHFGNVEPGTYTVCETAAPAGYIIDTTCQQLAVAQNASVQFGPFTNGLGDLLWAKIDSQTDAALGGATFTVTGTAGAAMGFSATLADNEAGKDADPDNGEFRLNNLKLGTYRITEITAPAGYDLPEPGIPGRRPGRPDRRGAVRVRGRAAGRCEHQQGCGPQPDRGRRGRRVHGHRPRGRHRHLRGRRPHRQEPDRP